MENVLKHENNMPRADISLPKVLEASSVVLGRLLLAMLFSMSGKVAGNISA